MPLSRRNAQIGSNESRWKAANGIQIAQLANAAGEGYPDAPSTNPVDHFCSAMNRCKPCVEHR